jgi:hypothetical protein
LAEDDKDGVMADKGKFNTILAFRKYSSMLINGKGSLQNVI